MSSSDNSEIIPCEIARQRRSFISAENNSLLQTARQPIIARGEGDASIHACTCDQAENRRDTEMISRGFKPERNDDTWADLRADPPEHFARTPVIYRLDVLLARAKRDRRPSLLYTYLHQDTREIRGNREKRAHRARDLCSVFIARPTVPYSPRACSLLLKSEEIASQSPRLLI